MSFFNFGGGYTSPPRGYLNAGSPTIPFCTSPSQLQEVTLNHDDTTFSNTMGLRSPGGPMRGRSVKEFEEQLTNLRKENFNLKLRIYFLEEKMGTNFTLDKDNVVKKNVELQVEVENLKKEVQEKHELLCQAVKAMELEDEDHKKYISNKEEELQMCQQELEDLRIQLHETKFDSDGLSLKSDITGLYSSRGLNSGNIMLELQEKVRILEQELQLEKENNASLQLVISQTETIRKRYDSLLKEFQQKEEVVKKLRAEIEAANEKVVCFNDQLKEFQAKLDSSYKENQALQKQIQTENKRFEECMHHLNEIKKKYAVSRADLEREHKRSERIKMMNEIRISELEGENGKYQEKIRELQSKLDAAAEEIRKNQCLAVPKSPIRKSNTSHTDVHSLSASNTTTPSGTPKKESLHVQINKSCPSTITRSASTPEKLDISELENFMLSIGNDDGDVKIIGQFKSLKSENSTLRKKIILLKSEQLKACDIIKSMMVTQKKHHQEIDKLQRHCAELECELESKVSKPMCEGDGMPLQQIITSRNIQAVKPNDENSMAETGNEDLEVAEHYKTLIGELEAKIDALVATLNEKDVQLQKVKEHYEEILKSLEDKENRVADLEIGLYSRDSDKMDLNRTSMEKQDSGFEKHSSFYRHEIEEKDREISRLTDELKKCTCYLQEIVNKELWDKNKEIEKLHNKQVNSPEIVKLKRDLSGKDLQLKILKEKISELGIDINIPSEEISASKEILHHIKQEPSVMLQEQKDNMGYVEIIHKLKEDNAALKLEIDNLDKLRLESNQVCALLNSRLEELAIFLDSLLKQKSVLGLLGIQKERRIRDIINTSLDLSKSFTMSMINNPDQSLTQLSNITALLNGTVFQDVTLGQPREDEQAEESTAVLTIIPDNITLTYQNHLQIEKNTEPKKDDVIVVLREQISKLKNELQLRDNELNRLNNLYISDKKSETEEYLRNRSVLGYKDKKVFASPNKNQNTSTTLKQESEWQSESESWSEPDRVVSRARIGLSVSCPMPTKVTKELFCYSTEEESLTNKYWHNKSQNSDELRQQVLFLQEEVESKDLLIAKIEAKISSSVTKEMYEDLDNRFKETEAKLIEVERRKGEAESLVDSLQRNVDELIVTKKYLEETLSRKDKESQNIINQLQMEKDNSVKLIESMKIQLCEANKQYQEYEMKWKDLHEEMFEIEKNLRTEYHELTVAKIKDVEKDYLDRLRKVEEDNKEEIQRVKNEYLENYIKKSDVEDKLRKVEQLLSELEDLKVMVKKYECKVEKHRKREEDLKNQLTESEDKNNNFRKELENAALQNSEILSEKTILSSEKSLLEQELTKYCKRDEELKQQISNIKTEFDAVKESCREQISSLQKQKSKLEVRITELESANAELYNKLVRLQANSSHLNSSLPNICSRNIPLQSYQRQLSDQPYSSEDNMEEHNIFDRSRLIARNIQHAELDRREANSSPDLGIESDHGRFSSLETQTNVTRPLLQTLQLTESMNNLLDTENNRAEAVNCGTEFCCQRTTYIINENSDLKRRLLQMRRALEDTAKQLNLANQRKKQVEKTICNQIHKTSQVLRKAKANLDSGSESDMITKM